MNPFGILLSLGKVANVEKVEILRFLLKTLHSDVISAGKHTEHNRKLKTHTLRDFLLSLGTIATVAKVVKTVMLLLLQI